MVIVEAMVAGTPVVATDCPYGPAEILEGGSGILVSPRDSAALADAMERVLTDSVLRQNLRDQATRRAPAFHANAVAPEYADMFERLADGAPGE